MSKKDGNDKEGGLSDYGIIYISGGINDSISESVCKEIIEHNVKGEIDHIQMIINSPGGSCSAGFAIVDLMEWSRLPIYTTGIGMIASMGLMLFMAGSKGHRVITPRTSILSHRFGGINIGNHSQLVAGRKEEDLEHQRIVEHYIRYSNIQNQKQLEAELLRDVDTWLTADEAVSFGIADLVERVRKRVSSSGKNIGRGE